jgi:hypothetical protein
MKRTSHGECASSYRAIVERNALLHVCNMTAVLIVHLFWVGSAVLSRW